MLPKSDYATLSSLLPPSESILQVKIRLLGVSPMVWRRVRVPESYSLREFHGVIQVAMGWESLHLFEFRIRAVRYGSTDICPEPPDKTLDSFAFRKNARFAYVYDMGDCGSMKSASKTGKRPRNTGAIRSASAARALALQKIAAVPTGISNSVTTP